MALGERLRKLRQQKGLTQAQLGAYFNLAESSISLYESGKRSPDYATLQRFAVFFAVSADYLLGYPDAAVTARETCSPYNPEQQPQPLPVINQIRKEGNRFHYEQTDTQEWYLANPPAERLFWYQIAADTLTGDGILPGDLALIEEPAQLSQGEVALVYLNDEGECLLYKVFKQDHSLILQCSNPQYPPRIYTGKEVSKIKIIGTVKEIRRKY